MSLLDKKKSFQTNIIYKKIIYILCGAKSQDLEVKFKKGENICQYQMYLQGKQKCLISILNIYGYFKHLLSMLVKYKKCHLQSNIKKRKKSPI